ncbi:hypothetical protein [Rhizobium arsenicireducens]
MNKKFNHLVSIGFTVVSHDAKGEDFTPEMLKAALLKRINTLNDSEWLEAVEPPMDSYGYTIIPEHEPYGEGNGWDDCTDAEATQWCIWTEGQGGERIEAFDSRVLAEAYLEDMI